MFKTGKTFLVCCCLLGGILGSCEKKESEIGTNGGKYEKRVTLDVIAFVSMVEPDGRRSDPVSKYLEEELNINLELMGTIEANYPTQLAAMIASNDLPDIFMLSNPTFQLPMLFASKSILNLEPYLKEWAPNSSADPNGLVMMEALRRPAFSPDGNLYTWGLCKGSWDDGTQPTAGHYIQWDVYKKAGYPKLENYDEDLLDVLEAMVKAEPYTRTGEKTWGLGSWFGDGQGWGESFFRSSPGPEEGVILNVASSYTLAINTADSSPINTNQMTDPNSYYWRSVRFCNRAYQRGLLDPDSFTQKEAIYSEKVRNGVYMLNVPGWVSGDANAEFNSKPGNGKAYISLPAIGANKEQRFENMYQGERQYGVSATTENPERCVALLDFVSTYEFSRIMFNGLEGTNWNMIDGKPVPTDEFLSTMVDDAFRVRTGVRIYHHFMGYGNGTIDPLTGIAVDLYRYSPQAVAKKLTPAHKDFIGHYGKTEWTDIYKSETAITDTKNFLSFADPPGSLKSYINGLDAYRGMNFAKLIAAKSDVEFEKMLSDFIAGMKDYHVDEIFDHFYQEAIAQKGQVDRLITLMGGK
jgi:ABC-type glycerol-3-phosphate transport system substrate-binding protein